jgi:hypothetical protein
VPEGASLPMPLDPNDTTDINWVLKRMSIVAGN